MSLYMPLGAMWREGRGKKYQNETISTHYEKGLYSLSWLKFATALQEKVLFFS